MGMSFDNDVILVCDKDEREWFNTLPKRNDWNKELPGSHFDVECPVWLRETTDDGKVLYVSSQSYGVIDWKNNLPPSCVGVVSLVYSYQSQDINYVETIEEHELEEHNWKPYGKLDIDFDFDDNLPEGEEDETDEESDERWEGHRQKLHDWMTQLWWEGQVDLGVKEPFSSSYN